MEKSISLSRIPVAPSRRKKGIGPGASVIAASVLVGIYVGTSNLLINWF
jgi:hypothetical protein